MQGLRIAEYVGRSLGEMVHLGNLGATGFLKITQNT
jgi:hypothetical protein